MNNFVELLGIWVGAIYILMVYSYLYKDNPLFKFAQSTVLGGAVAHITLMAIQSVNRLVVGGLMEGKIIYVLPIIFGVTLYARYYTEYRWITRYGLAVITGSFVGIRLGPEISAVFIKQVKSSMLSFSTANIYDSIGHLIIAVFTAFTIIYFIFDKKLIPKPSIHKKTMMLGRLALSCSIGYTAGTYFITRFSFLIDRLQYLFFTWIGLG